jgi:hypothetical protein
VASPSLSKALPRAPTGQPGPHLREFGGYCRRAATPQHRPPLQLQRSGTPQAAPPRLRGAKQISLGGMVPRLNSPLGLTSRAWGKVSRSFLQRGRRLLAHLGDGGRPSWRPLIGVVLPPLWHQGQKGQPTPRTRSIAAPTGSARAPSGGAGVFGASEMATGRRGGAGRDPGAPRRRRHLAPRTPLIRSRAICLNRVLVRHNPRLNRIDNGLLRRRGVWV